MELGRELEATAVGPVTMVPVEQVPVMVVTEPEEKAEMGGPDTKGRMEAATGGKTEITVMETVTVTDVDVENKEGAAAEQALEPEPEKAAAAVENKEGAAAEHALEPEPEKEKEATANGGSDEATEEDDPEAMRDQMLQDWSDLGVDTLLEAALLSTTR